MATSISPHHLGAIALTAFMLVTACSDSGSSGADACIWGVNELLDEVGASTAARTDCGSFNGLQRDDIAAAQPCLDSALKSGESAQLTVNRCIDCSIPSVFVATEGELFRIELEEDLFGDEQRVATVESCKTISLDVNRDLVCDGAAVLYQCTEPLDR